MQLVALGMALIQLQLQHPAGVLMNFDYKHGLASMTCILFQTILSNAAKLMPYC
jgi:hypothetical protein